MRGRPIRNVTFADEEVLCPSADLLGRSGLQRVTEKVGKPLNGESVRRLARIIALVISVNSTFRQHLALRKGAYGVSMRTRTLRVWASSGPTKRAVRFGAGKAD